MAKSGRCQASGRSGGCGRSFGVRVVSTACAAAWAGCFTPSLLAEDSSPAPILQYFESGYGTLESRMGDVFKAGYGLVYTPPPGRADQGGFSVGYDQFNRFDLGTTTSHTLYGTETGIRSAVSAAHTAGLDFGVDLVLNHNGYSGTGTAAQNAAFAAAGGYPGFVTVLQTTTSTAPGYNTRNYTAVDGDFHGVYDGGDHAERLAGLIDIDQGTNFQFIRQPTTAGNPLNIPAGTVNNRPDPNNARFYPDTSGAAGVKYLFDPKTGDANIPVYNFNTANPMAGTPVAENATGLLMRNAQWLVQAIGVDAFRLDATKHLDSFMLDYYDRAVYRANPRVNLDGSTKNVYSWGEAYSTDTNYLKTMVRKDINPSDPGRIGGDRDTLDFPLFFSLRSNLTSNGLNNSWLSVVGSSLDYADDGTMNGSIGVKFAQSHDDDGANLSNVSYAYTLMTPGQSIVYDNAKEFGTNRNFPKSGRGDALGGAYGETITKLSNIRNVYAQGNFIQRFLSKESYAFERNRQSLTLLSNRSDNVYENANLQSSFAAGTYLVELTGNAAAFGAPQVMQVKPNGTVDVSFLPNNGGDHGYLVYGLQAPQGSVTLGNISQTLAGGSTTLTGDDNAKAYQNATRRLTNVKVITGNTFTATLNTTAVNLLGSIRDRDADGDNAVFKLDGGLNLNGNAAVDYRTPGSVVYGFEEFTGSKSPGYNNASGNGSYSQTINTSGLGEGYHYLTVRAFRRRTDGGPAVYQDFKEVLYVDREKPISSVNAFKPFGTGAGDNDLWIKSDDQTANSVKAYLNLPANLTDAQILAKVAAGQGGTEQLDRDIFKTGFFGIPNGNNVITTVTYEITGNYRIQRFTGQTPANARGAGLGDTDFNGSVTAGDISGTSYGVEHFVYAKNAEFNPAADANGDGLVDARDVFALETRFAATSNTAVKNALRQVALTRGNISGDFGTNAFDIDLLYKRFGETGSTLWFDDLNADGVVNQFDVDALVRNVLHSQYGDADLDGGVSINDFNRLASNFGKATGQTWATGDFDGDGGVSINDFNLLANYFGSTNATPAEVAAFRAFAATVPEPTGLATASGLAALALRRRRRAPVS